MYGEFSFRRYVDGRHGRKRLQIMVMTMVYEFQKCKGLFFIF
jgi:hypothetical protein